MSEQSDLERMGNRLTSLEAAIKTCSGDECKLIQEQTTALKAAIEATVAEHVKAAIDSRLDALNAKLSEIDAALVKSHATPNPPAAPVIPDSSYFTCPQENDKGEVCGTVLDLTNNKCPACGTPVQWADTFAAVVELQKPKA
jgi:hypothetical protein